MGVEDALDSAAEAAVKAEGAMPTLAPGTQHVGQVMSAKVSFQCPVFSVLRALGYPACAFSAISQCVGHSAVWHATMWSQIAARGVF